MARGAVSEADDRLLADLRAVHQHVSAAQLERWRTAGAIPRNTRRGLGRGRGSASTVSKNSRVLAEAIAVTHRRGRSIYESVLRVFMADPELHDLLDDITSSCIPERGIRSAFDWFVRKGDRTLDRRIERRLALVKDLDEAVDIIQRMTAEHYGLLRRYGQTGAEYLPEVWKLGPSARNDVDHVAMAVARHFGPEEIGVNRIAEALARSILERWSPRLGEPPSFEVAADNLRDTLLGQELAGEKGWETEKHMSIGETVARLGARPIADFHYARERIGAVAQVGWLFTMGHVGDHLEVDKVLDVIAGTIEHNALFHMIIPIVDTLKDDAWHRMAAIAVEVLVQRPSEQILNDLAAALVPTRFS